LGTTRAEDAQGTPTQSHISPSILVYADNGRMYGFWVEGREHGIGIVFAALVNSFARNPSLRQHLFGFTILGFALTEAIGLFALMMAFLILSGYRASLEVDPARLFQFAHLV